MLNRPWRDNCFSAPRQFKTVGSPEIIWDHFLRMYNKLDNVMANALRNCIFALRAHVASTIFLCRNESASRREVFRLSHPCYFSPPVTPYFIAFRPHTGSTACFHSQQVQYDLKRYTLWNPWIVSSSGPQHFLLDFIWFIYLFSQFGQDSHGPPLWWSWAAATSGKHTALGRLLRRFIQILITIYMIKCGICNVILEKSLSNILAFRI